MKRLTHPSLYSQPASYLPSARATSPYSPNHPPTHSPTHSPNRVFAPSQRFILSQENAGPCHVPFLAGIYHTLNEEAAVSAVVYLLLVRNVGGFAPC